MTQTNSICSMYPYRKFAILMLHKCHNFLYLLHYPIWSKIRDYENPFRFLQRHSVRIYMDSPPLNSDSYFFITRINLDYPNLTRVFARFSDSPKIPPPHAEGRSPNLVNDLALTCSLLIPIFTN